MELKNQNVFEEIFKLLEDFKKEDPICQKIIKDLLEEAFLEHNQNRNRGIDKQLYTWIERKADKILDKEDNNENQ